MPPHATRAPPFAQKGLSGSIAVPQAAHACSSRRPHFPQKRSPGRSAIPQEGQAASRPEPAAGFAVQSSQRMTAAPRRRPGFHRAVFFPHSAQVRSRGSPASTMKRSGRAELGGEGSLGGGTPTAMRIGAWSPKNLVYTFSFEMTTLFTRGASSAASCSRYVRYPDPTLKWTTEGFLSRSTIDLPNFRFIEILSRDIDFPGTI